MTPDSPLWDRGRHADRRPFLAARVNILRAVRAWFHDQGFVEADVGTLVVSPGAETHVAAFETRGRYLHTSPEFAMKKLLAAGEEKIFYLGKCYRAGEAGPLHAPEFTMLEWYRADAPYAEVMADCLALLRAACVAANSDALRWRDQVCDPAQPARRLTVAQAFQGYAGVDLLGGDLGPARDGESWGDQFSRILVEKIEPALGQGAPSLLCEYPIEEAALARRCAHDPRVAERFELYACGVELANGFGELTEPAEQRARLEQAMAEKQKRYGERWPIDEDFLAALGQMPAASGVALGFDRLVMLASGARAIQDVLWAP